MSDCPLIRPSCVTVYSRTPGAITEEELGPQALSIASCYGVVHLPLDSTVSDSGLLHTYVSGC